LWGYVSESSRRLWEDLTPVPTRKNSIRFITTYSGFTNESNLLWDLYKQAVGKDEHPEGQGERLHPDLPIYANREARIFAYWDHEPRMPWQTTEYYDAQKKTLRPGTYLRLHENQWATAEKPSSHEMWDRASIVRITRARLIEARFSLASTWASNTTTRRVAVKWDEQARVDSCLASYLKPSPSSPWTGKHHRAGLARLERSRRRG
jgi:hypothetical protein